MDLKIIKLSTEDLDIFVDLIRIFEVVFEIENFRMPEKSYLQKLLNKADFIVFVAIKNGQVIGGLTAYTLDQYYSRKPLAYLYDLAIISEFQRQGIGKKLISNLLLYCKKKGYEEMFLQADKVDNHALDFYGSTPITDEEQVIHFTYNLGN